MALAVVKQALAKITVARLLLFGFFDTNRLTKREEMRTKRHY